MGSHPELSIFRDSRMEFVQGFYQKLFLLFCLTAVLLVGALLIGVSVIITPPKTLPGQSTLLIMLNGYAQDLEYSLLEIPFIDIEPYQGFPTNVSLVVTSSEMDEIASNAFILTSQDRLLQERLSLSVSPMVIEDSNTIAVGPEKIRANGETLQLMMFWKKRTSLWHELVRIITTYPAVVLISLLGSVCFCLLLAVMLRPLHVVQMRVREIADGDLDARLPEYLTRRQDEIGELCRDFNTMAERLQDMRQGHERLLRHVSHELRTPLTRMQLALALAKNKAAGLARSEHDRMERDINHLNYLIGQILTWSRIVNFSQARPRKWFALDEVIHELVDNADFEAAAENRAVVVTGMCLGCNYYGDQDWLASAVENLVRNAIRFSPENDTIDVNMACHEHTIVIVVRDRGLGVLEDEIELLFEPFYRVDETRGGDNRGTGLGLAIARAAVEGHGGTIVARNADPGLEVTITLPLPRVVES